MATSSIETSDNSLLCVESGPVCSNRPVLWTQTRPSVAKLEHLLSCLKCHKLMEDPHILASCDHYFCKRCILSSLVTHSMCPSCGLPAWVKDVKPNHQLNNVITSLHMLKSVIGSPPQDHEPVDDSESIWGVSSVFSTPPPTVTSLPRHCDMACRYKQDLRKDVFLKPPITKSLLKRRVKSNRNPSVRIPSPPCEAQVLPSPPNIKLPRVPLNQLNHRRAISLDSTAKVWSTGDNLCEVRPTKKRRSDPIVIPSSLQEEFPFTPLVTKMRSFQKLDSASKIKRLCKTSSSTHRNIPDHKSSNTKHTKLRQLTLGTVLQLSKNKPTPSASHSFETSSSSSHFIEPSSSTSHCIAPSSSGVAPPTPSVTLGITMRRNIRGETPLHIAAIKGNCSEVQHLLEQGAYPNAQDNAGWTPLHEACNHGHLKVVELLLASGALVNIPGYNNDTPLHDAVAGGHEQVVTLLLSYGANASIRNRHGCVPADLAVSTSMKDLFLNPPSSSSSSSSSSSTSSSPLSLVLSSCSSSPVSPVITHDSKVVLLSSGLNQSQKSKLYVMASLTGAKVVNEFGSKVTHVVTQCDSSGCCVRTMKCLCAIASGCWLLKYSWVTHSIRDRVRLAELPYEVSGMRVSGSQQLSEAARKGRETATMKSPGLFDGCCFFFVGSFSPPNPSKDDLQHLVRLAGGQLLTREPRGGDPQLTATSYPFHAQPDTLFSVCHKFIVFDPLSKHHRIEGNKQTGIATVPASWILDCISSFQLVNIQS